MVKKKEEKKNKHRAAEYLTLAQRSHRRWSRLDRQACQTGA